MRVLIGVAMSRTIKGRRRAVLARDPLVIERRRAEHDQSAPHSRFACDLLVTQRRPARHDRRGLQSRALPPYRTNNSGHRRTFLLFSHHTVALTFAAEQG